MCCDGTGSACEILAWNLGWVGSGRDRILWVLWVFECGRKSLPGGDWSLKSLLARYWWGRVFFCSFWVRNFELSWVGKDFLWVWNVGSSFHRAVGL